MPARRPAALHFPEEILVLDFSALSSTQPWVQAALGLAGLLLLAGLLERLACLLIGPAVRWLQPLAESGGLGRVLLDRAVLRRATLVVPVLVLHIGLRFVPELSPLVTTVVQNVVAALMVLFIARTLFKVLDLLQRTPDSRAASYARSRSIKAYVQMGKLVVGVATIVIMIAALADKSPLIVLSGFGAMSAVLMLVFQDIIKSFVAGLQIEGNDMMRVGDWIEVPQAGADGAVIDIALNTVKVQNWDKTIVTIPTWKLISESFRNWRGMQESGGRRIKRALMIDADSIDFLSDEQIERLRRIELIADYMQEKANAVKISRAMKLRELGDVMGRVPTNQRRLTNIGTFRAYVQAYLKANSGIHPDMTLMVRMLQPTAEGVPLELYCFTNTIVWVDYETIQSDVFDHLLAILPEFGLRVFQNPSGAGLRAALGEWRRESKPDGALPRVDEAGHRPG
ncbi:mechanosensitive ion channel domain-containing protein [Ottowia sp.]|uniref:mechanosensitive ion channel family protein n=1 Tax=Ottowia sp. TaxID=1898956 RepID=UPI002BE0460B|nr:mechanosensitive ion channel domain-containing protein [Ottowia sp.]HRN74705.1 mechanosensitive ion channel [Ottowia sp.]HRQ01535.1 mechanosensitive ion channel [Ottowia sp.]